MKRIGRMGERELLGLFLLQYRGKQKTDGKFVGFFCFFF